ncbi:cytochrome c oxidase subunit 1 [Conoideocrella luteorostrata]|uniref:Amine oxidase n=1 Tax=Conoideocrella luteorostrata TaxID=1105319 RepID=A0AAJ0CDR7_9HYPO|nr:cytochrome c oxidase subunit 1 [Conoideocrella luteorostrata]
MLRTAKAPEVGYIHHPKMRRYHVTLRFGDRGDLGFGRIRGIQQLWSERAESYSAIGTFPRKVAASVPSLRNTSSGCAAQSVEKNGPVPGSQGRVDWTEYDIINKACDIHPDSLAEVADDPGAYGTDDAHETRRLFQCYLYAVINDDSQANHYSIQPLQVLQLQGPSFSIIGRQVLWQKWTSQLGWNLREGPRASLRPVSRAAPVLQDFDERDDGAVRRPQITLPSQAGIRPRRLGVGLTSKSLELGCDCLGHIAYFDGVRITSSGDPVVMEKVVCMHKTDQGLGWKHTNWRNGMVSTIKDRQLIIQCTATIANYEYMLAFILDQCANLHIEVRATGIVSTMPIRQGVHSPWGTVVAPGVLACNHQHLFCLRVNPMLDGDCNNTIIYDDCIPVRGKPELDPAGCAYPVHTTRVDKVGSYDLDVFKNRTFKIVNDGVINSVLGKPIGCKLQAIPSQMLMMNAATFNYRPVSSSQNPFG